ncbi:MAG: winged helix-turn-helix domain-containing protein [Sulfolobaceae archaeon]
MSTEELIGTSKRIYYYLLRQNKPVTARQIQRDLNISSISVVNYHLKKLLEKGLVEETENGYIVKKIVDKNLVRVKSLILPKSAFFASFFITSLIISTFFLYQNSKIQQIYMILVILIASIYFLYDTIKKWRDLKNTLNLNNLKNSE